jgi:hypothetical protein
LVVAEGFGLGEYFAKGAAQRKRSSGRVVVFYLHPTGSEFHANGVAVYDHS